MAREMKALGDDCNGGLMVVAAVLQCMAREMKALGDDCNGGLMVVAAVHGKRDAVHGKRDEGFG